MAPKIDQKAYLQYYLGGSTDTKKKKKKKKVIRAQGLKIIDDDLDLSKLRPLDHDELDIFDEGEDAPQIAGIIDERPEELKKMEQFSSSSKWRVISQHDGFNSNLEIKEVTVSNKEQQKENEIIFGKMYSDSEEEDNEKHKEREKAAIKRKTEEDSGRNAQVVSRKRKRETSEERRKNIEKAERQKVLDEKYKKLGKGLKQIEAQEARVQDFIHESAKPVARYRDDIDLENSRKQQERHGDPLKNFITKHDSEPAKPKYKGNYPSNRFNICPGYRWDGVDRSNGYEKKLFEHQSKRKAEQEEAQKWSTEDL